MDMSINVACRKNSFRKCFFFLYKRQWTHLVSVYNLIHRLTTTNAYLYIIGSSETPLCSHAMNMKKVLFIYLRKSLWTSAKILGISKGK